MTKLEAGWRDLRRSLTRDKLRDAARLGVQAAAAAVATLVLLALIGVNQPFLGVISAVLVLDPSRDATIRNALQRLVATFIGTLVGGAGLVLTPRGELVSVAAVMLLMGAIAVIRPQWRYGFVAAVGLAVGADGAVWQTALDRTIAIFTGAAAGILAGFLIWPKSSRGYAIDHLREALGTCNQLLRSTIALAVEDADKDVSALHSRFIQQIDRASSAAKSLRLAQARQKRLLDDAIHSAERLWHALIILDRVAETKSQSSVVGEQRSRQVEKLKEQCCAALSCLERLEPVQAACLDAIEKSGVELDLVRSNQEDADRVERFGLTYGLHEVVRNIGELSNAVAQLASPSAAEGSR